MKTRLLPSLALLLISVAFAGCNPQRPDAPKAGEATDKKPEVPVAAATSSVPADAIQNNDPVAGTLDEIKTLTFESRSTVTEIADKLDRQISALMAQWTAAGRQFPSENEAQFRNSRRVLTQKLNALTYATPETWNTAKDEATAALQNLRGALHAMEASAK